MILFVLIFIFSLFLIGVFVISILLRIRMKKIEAFNDLGFSDYVGISLISLFVHVFSLSIVSTLSYFPLNFFDIIADGFLFSSGLIVLFSELMELVLGAGVVFLVIFWIFVIIYVWVVYYYLSKFCYSLTIFKLFEDKIDFDTAKRACSLVSGLSFIVCAIFTVLYTVFVLFIVYKYIEVM